MSNTLFKIREIINNSGTPLSVEEIAEQLNVGIRTVQRHAMTLVKERLVGIEFKGGNVSYDFRRNGKVTHCERASNAYVYYKL